MAAKIEIFINGKLHSLDEINDVEILRRMIKAMVARENARLNQTNSTLCLADFISLN